MPYWGNAAKEGGKGTCCRADECKRETFGEQLPGDLRPRGSKAQTHCYLSSSASTAREHQRSDIRANGRVTVFNGSRSAIMIKRSGSSNGRGRSDLVRLKVASILSLLRAR
jgi:hypothetical protein